MELESARVESSVAAWLRSVVAEVAGRHEGETFFGMAVEVSGWDPGISVHLGCAQPAHGTRGNFPVSEEVQRRTPAYWAYDHEATTGGEEAGMGWLAELPPALFDAEDEERETLLAGLMAGVRAGLAAVVADGTLDSLTWEGERDLVVFDEDEDLDEARSRTREALRSD